MISQVHYVCSLYFSKIYTLVKVHYMQTAICIWIYIFFNYVNNTGAKKKKNRPTLFKTNLWHLRYANNEHKNHNICSYKINSSIKNENVCLTGSYTFFLFVGKRYYINIKMHLHNIELVWMCAWDEFFPIELFLTVVYRSFESAPVIDSTSNQDLDSVQFYYCKSKIIFKWI